METELLPFLALSVFGVSAVTALVWVLDRRAPASLGDAESATRRFARDFPDEPVATVTRATDGGGALLELERPQAFGVVLRLGQRFTTRRFRRDEVEEVARDGDALVIRLADFTMPTISLRLAGEHEAWRDRLLPGEREGGSTPR